MNSIMNTCTFIIAHVYLTNNSQLPLLIKVAQCSHSAKYWIHVHLSSTCIPKNKSFNIPLKIFMAYEEQNCLFLFKVIFIVIRFKRLQDYFF